MSRFVFLVACGMAMIGGPGCGPLQAPMPVRLSDEDQQNVEKAWAKALTPVDHLNHQGMLDVLLASTAYESGVDKLSFRSEKKVAAGVVVMEIEFDRLLPDQDRFDVTVFDDAHQLLRQETYRRKEIEDTYHDLFVTYHELKWKSEQKGMKTPEGEEALTLDEFWHLEDLKARHAAIEEILPKKKENSSQAKVDPPK